MRKYLFLCVVLLALSAAGCGEKVDETHFTDLYAAEMQRLEPGLQIKVVAPLELEYSKSPGGEKSSAFLDNAYNLYVNGEDLDVIIRKYAGASVASLQDQGAETGNIVPVVKDKQYIDEINATLKKKNLDAKAIPFYWVPYAGELAILYAVDTPENIRYTSRDDIKKLKLPDPELLSLAIKNLKSRLPEFKIEGEGGLFTIVADGNYESSLLLFDDLWERMAPQVNGSLVIAIPSRDVLLVTGDRNKEGLVKMKAKALEIAGKASYKLTANLYVREKKGWKKFD